MKYLFLFFALLCSALPAHAGPFSLTKDATSSQNITGSGIVWTDPDKAAVEDGTPAKNFLNPSEQTDFVNGTTGGFSFGTGITVTITGVLCEANAVADLNESAQIQEAYLTVDNGVASSSPVGASKPLNDTYDWGNSGNQVGGDGEMWGLTSAGIKSLMQNKFFGCSVSITEIGGNAINVGIDGIRVTAFYNINAKTLAAMGAGQ